jgi:transcriptional regulatory protein RtcR
MKKVIIGLLGSTHDKRKEDKLDKDKWRPTVSLFQSDTMKFDRLELIHQTKIDHKNLAEQIREDIQEISPQTEVILHQIKLKNPRKFDETYLSLFNFAKSYTFAPDNEYFIHITTGTHIAQICLFLLTEAKYFPGKLVQSLRPEKGRASKLDIIDLELKTYNLISKRYEEERHQETNFLRDNIKTKNESFNRIIDEIQAVAVNSADPILLTGATGTGKSKLARLVYKLKIDNNQLVGKFVEVNCATLRGDNAMSALFGHKKGTFTGVGDRSGCIKEAENGLLFLDEIGELGLEEQAMLLKAIEEKKFPPYGSDEEINVNFQLIAGTNKNLYEKVCDGKFRGDLLNRIDHWEYELPSLCQRREDIEPNLYFELERRNKKIEFTDKALKLFLDFAQSPEALWLGNFRDFTRSISRMATFSTSKKISDNLVKIEIERLKDRWSKLSQIKSKIMLEKWITENCSREIDPFEMIQLKGVIEICLQHCSLADAARDLFSVTREKLKNPNDSDRLRKYLIKFGLSWDVLQTIHK